MEEDEMPKFQRNHSGNGKMGLNGRDGDEEEGDEELKRGGGGGGGGSGGGGGRGRGNGGAQMEIIAANNHGGGLSKLYNWPSSRIFRVSRASGGKDRHSKVWTSKGLRDRRVRLSVPTAIQFYDLQDRLGYDQPSKAVEWLLTAAATSIAELPSISTPFPDTPQQLTDARRSSTTENNQRRLDLAEVGIDENDEDENNMMCQQESNGGLKNLSKSGCCSSPSETSKGSGLSFSRPESRIKARERARERAAGKEKEKEIEGSGGGHQKLNPISQNSSFTELLTSGIHNNNQCPTGNGNLNESNFFQKPQIREWMPSSTSMEYFGSSFLSPSNARPNFLSQIQLGNPLHQQQPVSSSSSPPLMFSVAGDQNQHFSFLPDHLVPVVVRGGGGHGGGGGSSSNNNNNGDYNLNFSVSSGSYNRGTLQSNSSSSPSMLPHQIQRFPTIDGPSAFFISPTTTTTPVTNASVPGHHHHQHFLSGFDPQLQLCYDSNSSSRQHHDHNKGKGKNSAS